MLQTDLIILFRYSLIIDYFNYYVNSQHLIIHHKDIFNIYPVYCYSFELSNFEHKFIKGFADSRRNLQKSTNLINKSLFFYSATINRYRFRLDDVILLSFLLSPQGTSDNDPPPPSVPS